MLLDFIRFHVLNALTGPYDYLLGNPDYSCRNFLAHFPFDFTIIVIGMVDDMSAVASEVGYRMLER